MRKHGIDRREEMFNEEKRKGSWIYDMESLGFNYRITDFQAALGLSQLKKIDQFKTRRRKIVNYYNEHFSGIEELILPFEDEKVDSNFHIYVLQVKDNPRFDRYDHIDLGYAVFKRGDRFIEWFFTTRWYSIYQIHTHGNDVLKGWYCNITRPAMLIDSEIHTIDLALDLWVDECGTHRQLDTDEFAQLPISTQERSHANAGLSQLHELVEQRLPPFHIISRSPAQP